MRQSSYITAAPSWVMAGTIYENCVFLEDKVDEVGLLFFETDSCLNYGEEDLPCALADLNLQYHVHLPLDLPWNEPERVADIVVQLMQKVRFLNVERAVLHPPVTQGENAVSVQDALRALRTVAEVWNNAGYRCNDLLIENVEGADLTDLAPAFRDLGVGLCVDTGHIIAYGQDALLDCDELWTHLRMIHLNAPKDISTAQGRSRHTSLANLDEKGKQVVAQVLAHRRQDTVLMYELFKWEHILSTRTVVEQLLSLEGR